MSEEIEKQMNNQYGGPQESVSTGEINILKATILYVFWAEVLELLQCGLTIKD